MSSAICTVRLYVHIELLNDTGLRMSCCFACLVALELHMNMGDQHATQFAN